MSIFPRTGESLRAALRRLYDSYGYSRYKMSKFEEYDLYARNKDFLAFDGIITFTDTNGKLMALKPDVTLSIIKNTREQAGAVRKMYYNENVYRVAKGSRTFREIMQMGLEAIGDVDDFCVLEVLRLAAESLLLTGRGCVLALSHLGLLSDVLHYAGIPMGRQEEALNCIAAKNLHELDALCAALGLAPDQADLLRQLVSLYGSPASVIPSLRDLLRDAVPPERLQPFIAILTALDAALPPALLRIDFSIVSDPRYYSGFVFKGFAEGVPDSVLSGGQYDRLMREMKRTDSAIGFAVYLDRLEQFASVRAEYDVDDLLLYDAASSPEAVEREADSLRRQGRSVLAQRQVPPDIACRRVLHMREGEVISVENRA